MEGEHVAPNDRTGDIRYKYNEDVVLEHLMKYIQSTYTQHYVGKSGVQAIDVWKSLDIDEEAFRANIIKYAMRYKHKKGQEMKDLLKILHYTVLLLGRNHIEDMNGLSDR
jgi:hypothetical protein